MKVINDHYFVGWLCAVKGYNYKVVDSKLYVVGISNKEYKVLLDEYSSSVKDTLKSVRLLVKQLAKIHNVKGNTYGNQTT